VKTLISSNIKAMSESTTSMACPLLQEFEPLTNLLARVPRHVQKGVLMCDVAWTCVDVSDHWIVIGTDVGVVYVYNRSRETVVHQLTSQVIAVPVFIYSSSSSSSVYAGRRTRSFVSKALLCS